MSTSDASDVTSTRNGTRTSSAPLVLSIIATVLALVAVVLAAIALARTSTAPTAAPPPPPSPAPPAPPRPPSIPKSCSNGVPLNGFGWSSSPGPVGSLLMRSTVPTRRTPTGGPLGARTLPKRGRATV